MLDPITAAILLAIGIYELVCIIHLILLTFGEIVSWFRSHSYLVSSDKNNLAFTLQDMISNDEYVTVQGVFNTRANRVLEARKISSRDVDDQVYNIHRDKQLAIYS